MKYYQKKIRYFFLFINPGEYVLIIKKKKILQPRPHSVMYEYNGHFCFLQIVIEIVNVRIYFTFPLTLSFLTYWKEDSFSLSRLPQSIGSSVRFI